MGLSMARDVGQSSMHHTVRQSFGKQNGCMAGVFAGFDDDLSDALAVCSYSDACFGRTVTNGKPRPLLHVRQRVRLRPAWPCRPAALEGFANEWLIAA